MYVQCDKARNMFGIKISRILGSRIAYMQYKS